MNDAGIIDLSKVFLIAGFSIVVGVFVGSRSGGEYVFEIGINLAATIYIVVIIFPLLAIVAMIYNYYLNKMRCEYESKKDK